MVALVTTSHVVASWLSVWLTLATAAAVVLVANKARVLLLAMALDIIQVWSAWQAAQLDAVERHTTLKLAERQQRRRLLAQLDGDR
jgi:hypothetical protein